jgi:hypothetical protein
LFAETKTKQNTLPPKEKKKNPQTNLYTFENTLRKKDKVDNVKKKKSIYLSLF